MNLKNSKIQTSSRKFLAVYQPRDHFHQKETYSLFKKMIFNHLEKLCDAFNIDRPIIVVELALRTREKAEESQKFHFG